MAKPIAYFGYSKKGLTIQFEDNSLNKPTAWAWDFGDENTSTEQNPTHTYLELGSYVVKLSVINPDGASEPFEFTIRLGSDDGKLDITLIELIDHYLPSALRGEMSMKEKVSLIQNYQLYLQPLVEIPYPVSIEDTHNEKAWPGLANMLIAQLVTMDIITQGANQFITAAMTGATSIIDNGSGEETGTGEQQIKSIETGPTKTEWYEDSSAVTNSEMIKNIGEAYSNAVRAGGALDQLRILTCQQAARIRVYLPMCGPLDHTTIPPKVFKDKRNFGHNANPFGITKRMT